MTDKQTLLNEINEVSFAVNDLSLYLDTHPTDSNALELFQAYNGKRKAAMTEFAQNYYPLTMDCIQSDGTNLNTETNYAGQPHWSWCDGPVPWEGGIQ